VRVSPKGKRTVLVRADGSKSLGMGHLSRACLVVDAFAARGYDVRLLVKRNSDAASFLESRKMVPDFLPEDISLQAEFDLIMGRLFPTLGLLVTDVLNHRDYSRLFRELRREHCISAVIFDDESSACIDADIALNGSPSQSPEPYSDCVCRYLIGPRYFIMDPRYKDLSVAPPRSLVRDVFITVGGSDHHNLLFKLLRAFDRFGDAYRITIASTTTTGYTGQLADVLGRVCFPVALHLDAPSLLSFWSKADVAITAGGNTLFERIATRLPGATLCQLGLQMKHAESFERLGVNINLGYGPDLDHDVLGTKLERFLNDSVEHKEQYTRASDLVDARGLEYFIAALEEYQ
jgi:UDP-2,4-diacetamido-2,4,6-trideoxy-beta-L-altropyranose hydrolase